MIPGNKKNKNSWGYHSRSRRGGSSSVVTKHLDSALQNRTQHVMNVVRFPGFGFPDQLKACLRYKENGVSFTASTTPAAQVYRLNSLFDPNLTGTGHQPNYFDQLSAVYGFYCVTAARMKCQVLNEGTVEVDCVLVYSDINTSTQTVENLSEARWSKNIVAGIQSSGKSVVSFTLGTASIANLTGEKFLNTDPDQYAAVTANPADTIVGIFKMAAADGVTNVKAIVNFELSFDCIFKDLTPVAES